jgi:drug/metabolite transporter (DMT)-like permease
VLSNADLAAIPCAVGAAGAFAAANVVQMRAARRADAAEVAPGLLLRLVRDPLWLAGFASSVAGYGLQAVALFLAPVLLVQPLIVAELLFALPAAAHLAGVRLGRREWTGAGLVAAGMAAFVVVGHPAGERTRLSPAGWVTMTVAVGAAIALLVLLAETHLERPMLRASAFALAAGSCFGMLSVLTKVVGHEFAHDRLATLGRGQPWLLTVVAITGLWLAQTAFRIAPLSVSLPLIDVGEPVVASLLAVVAFGETIGSGTAVAAGVAVAVAAVVGGIALLDTSPIVRRVQEELHHAAVQRPAGNTATSPACADG